MITDRDRLAADGEPIPRGRLAALASAGLALPAKRRIADLPPPLSWDPATTTLGQLLAEARSDER